MDDLEVRLREAQEALSNYRELCDSLGWKRLMEVADGQMKLRMPGVLRKLESFHDLPGQEYEKGEVAGIELFMRLPEIAIEGLREDIESMEKELGYAIGERTDDGDLDGRDGSYFESGVPGI